MPSAFGLTGAAGEYYVAAELSRRGWLATVTIKNAPGTDVLAQRLDRRRVISIQTKTSSPGNPFTLNLKDEAIGVAENEWYVLVALGALDERPRFYVVPRHVMAAFTYFEHRDWLTSKGLLHKPAKPGQTRRSGTRRMIRHEWLNGYAECWDLLDAPTTSAPYKGSDEFLELARIVPLPTEFRPLTPPQTL